MKKQGMPEQISEAQFANLKRKAAGISVAEARADAKKQKISTEEPLPASNRDRQLKHLKDAPVKNNGLKNETKGKFTMVHGKKTGADVGRAITNGKEKTFGRSGGKNVSAKTKKNEQKKNAAKPVKAAPLPESDDESLGSDASDMGMNDEFDIGSGSEQEDEAKLGDDFLSDDESEVYDSEEDHKKTTMFSDDEDDSDREETLTAANIGGLSRKRDMELAREAAEAEAELQEAALATNIEGDKPKVFEDSDDEDALDGKAQLAPDLQLLRTRINDCVRVLDDFSNLAEEDKSRAEYVAQLLKDICAYYGYSPYLAEKLFNLFPPREAFAFFEANETPRPVVIRTNTLRTHRRDLAQALINRGVTLEPVGKWSKVGLQVFESAVPLGATPEYLAGHYILQAASSFLPVMALAPQENERVLDMASAPGGKTTYISALMKNTGCVFANDSNKARCKGLIGNIHRLGAKNTIVCNYDAREFPKVIGGFDRVLLDAPCSGTGVIAKDASVKTNKTEKDFLMLPHLQKQLLLSAIDSVDHNSKTGGYIVYSTCSVTVEENESVVQYALSRRPNVRLVETGLTFGKEGFTAYMGKTFSQSMKMTRRYYPHAYNVDGFFVAKFRKVAPTPANSTAGKTNVTPAKDGGELDVDKRPVPETDAEDEFAEFDEEDDEVIMERARKALLRKKGKNPKADKSAAKPLSEEEKATEEGKKASKKAEKEKSKQDIVEEGEDMAAKSEEVGVPEAISDAAAAAASPKDKVKSKSGKAKKEKSSTGVKK